MIKPVYIEILNLYKEFLELNHSFVNTRTTNDLRLPASFLVLDKFAEAHNFQDFVKKGNAMVSVSKIGNSSVILMKPQTYMNLSGDAVWPVVSFFKIPKARIDKSSAFSLLRASLPFLSCSIN